MPLTTSRCRSLPAFGTNGCSLDIGIVEVEREAPLLRRSQGVGDAEAPARGPAIGLVDGDEDRVVAGRARVEGRDRVAEAVGQRDEVEEAAGVRGLGPVERRIADLVPADDVAEAQRRPEDSEALADADAELIGIRRLQIVGDDAQLARPRRGRIGGEARQQRREALRRQIMRLGTGWSAGRRAAGRLARRAARPSDIAKQSLLGRAAEQRAVVIAADSRRRSPCADRR